MILVRHARIFLTALGTLLVVAPAYADQPDLNGAPAPAPADTPPVSGTSPPAAPPSNPPVSAVQSEERATTVVPKAAEPAPPGRPTFAVDPVADGAIIAGSAGFAGILDLINGTGEVRPQQISPTFDRSSLLGIDRGAISQNVDSNARTFSNIGIFAAIGYAVLDPILSGVREQNVQSGIVDAVIYAEAITMTWGVTNLAKMAVRRPRPQAYIDAAAHKGDPNYSNSNTDSSLSFFSGHASITASISATATYLAFVRSPHSARPWVTLGLGTALTTFVSVERVRGGAHFPTDVIAGAIAGAGIGVIVAHVHRTEDVKQRRVWVGFSPESAGGGSVQLGGVF
jgi:membrane-associated phospholipid phosphatase